jgi:hypothetical protein
MKPHGLSSLAETKGGKATTVLRKKLRAEYPECRTRGAHPGYGQTFAATTFDSSRGGSIAPLFSDASVRREFGNIKFLSALLAILTQCILVGTVIEYIL